MAVVVWRGRRQAGWGNAQGEKAECERCGEWGREGVRRRQAGAACVCVQGRVCARQRNVVEVEVQEENKVMGQVGGW